MAEKKNGRATGKVVRVIGRAAISTDPALCGQFVMQGKVPKVVLVVTVERAYYQRLLHTRKTKKEAIRIIKRVLARRLYRTLTST